MTEQEPRPTPGGEPGESVPPRATPPGEPPTGGVPHNIAPPGETPAGEESTSGALGHREPPELRKAWGPLPLVIIIVFTVIMAALFVAMAVEYINR